MRLFLMQRNRLEVASEMLSLHSVDNDELSAGGGATLDRTVESGEEERHLALTTQS